jgi:quercetin dioxygenase-like cupin family protein
MLAIRLDQLELLELWQEQDSLQQWKAQFPLMGIPDTDSLGAVYFELPPDEGLPVHTDSRDEIVVLLSGAGEASVGDETGEIAAPAMVFIPEMVPHGFRNTGEDTIRALGIFAGAAVVSSFEHDVMPLGIRVFDLTHVPAGS